MKISNFQTQLTGTGKRISATVIWENRFRSQNYFFETIADYAEDFWCNPDAFLLACIVPAMKYGEERVYVDAEICPELRHNLLKALKIIGYWSHYDRPMIKIEAAGFRQPYATSQGSKRTASFFTGGIDSFTTLRDNRLNYPADHPSHIKDCLIVYGYQDTTREDFENYLTTAQTFLKKEANIHLMPVYTNAYDNIRDFEDSAFSLWKSDFQGTALTAVAHTFSHRIGKILLSSTYDIYNLIPFGSHPLLDACFSSFDLAVQHEGATFTRLEKTALVSEWDLVLRELRVCDSSDLPPESINCGKCEKCIRTATALAALGKLEATQAFPYQDVTPSTLEQPGLITNSAIAAIYEELIPLLEEKNRLDLVKAIKRQVFLFKLRKFDQTFLGGALLKTKQLLKGRKTEPIAADDYLTSPSMQSSIS